MINLYHILHLTPSCTTIEVKRAFRKLAHKYHPDHNASAEAAQLFSQIMKAYSVLSNDALRAKYDALLMSKTKSAPTYLTKTDRYYKKYGTIGKFKNANPNYVVPTRKYPKWVRLERAGFYFMLGISIYVIVYSFVKLNNATSKSEFDSALNGFVGALLFAGIFIYCWVYLISLNKK